MVGWETQFVCAGVYEVSLGKSKFLSNLLDFNLYNILLIDVNSANVVKCEVDADSRSDIEAHESIAAAYVNYRSLCTSLNVLKKKVSSKVGHLHAVIYGADYSITDLNFRDCKQSWELAIPDFLFCGEISNSVENSLNSFFALLGVSLNCHFQLSRVHFKYQ